MSESRAKGGASVRMLLWSLLLTGTEAVGAPVIEMGEPENYCVTYCYIRVPFSVTNYGPGQKIGRVFCEFDAEVTATLPVYLGEARTRGMQASPIGVFKTSDGKGAGDVEMSTGVIKKYFVGAKTKSVRCHF